MRRLGLVWSFYKLFAFASLIITLSSLVTVYTWGIATITALFWFKVFTLALFVYYIQVFKRDVFYYYKNLGLSRKSLWVSTLSFDLTVFVMLIILTHSIR
jgi:hypothetical protein